MPEETPAPVMMPLKLAAGVEPTFEDGVARNTRVYTNPRVHIAVDDGRSFVRRTPDRYDVIQASLVDTWAATAAGAYSRSVAACKCSANVSRIRPWRR